MKKLISLLLVLVLSLGMLSGISLAADMPEQVAEADAGIKVTFAGSSEAYYFETLTQDLIAWAALEMPGAITFTLMKDLDLVNDREGGSRFLQMPQANAEWNGNNRPTKTGKLPMVFDLNGKTMKYEGSAAMFRFDRYGATFKNGTIIYNLTDKGRPMFVSGTTGGAVATTNASSVYTPEVVLDNVFCYAAGDGYVFASYTYGIKLTATNSVLWSEENAAISVQCSTQEGLAEGSSVYEGAYAPVITLKNCVVGSGKSYPMAGSKTEGATVTAEDTVFVTNKADGKLLKDDSALATEFAQTVTEKDGWTLTKGDKTMTGKAHVVGNDPTDVKLPFTDVKEGDWFYSFVKEMYGKKIIAGQTATTFNPNGNLTYGAALKLLTVGVTGKDAGNAASGHWATNYLNEAVAAGWTTIGADKLDAPVTREAFCEIAAKAKNLTEKAENPFKDTTNDAVLALVKAGVISGMSADTFAPQGVLTRAQIAKIISLLIKL